MTLPKAFVTHMQSLMGTEWPSFRDSLLTAPPHRAVRLHRWTLADVSQGAPDTSADYALQAPPCPVPETVRQRLGSPVPWAADGFYIEPDSTLGKTFFHEAGAFYIQEPSAMAVAIALAAKPGERILDLCAAPGGKTTAIAKHMRSRGVLVANEIHPTRVLTLAQNLERMGVNAVITNETPQRLAEAMPGWFDGVLVDAPCSGEGMFRKDPLAHSAWDPTAPETCAARQREILQAAARMVRPGGRIVYSTCTFNPIENEQVIAWAAANLPVTIQALPAWPEWDSGRADWADGNPRLPGTRRLWPHHAGGEGHFVALLHVDGYNTSAPKAVRHTQPKIPDGWQGWLEDIVQVPIPVEWLHPCIIKDHCFTSPPPDINLGKLRVLRPGLCLAIHQKHRYEPHHSLAMAIAGTRVARNQELSVEEAIHFFGGQAWNGSTALKGHVRMHHQGLPLGWGKAVADRINNLYPKGLRKHGLLP